MRARPVYAPQPLAWPPGRRVIYLVDKAATLEGRGLIIELAHETPKKDGSPDRPKQLKIGREQVNSLPDLEDRQIVQMLLGARRGDYGYYGYYDSDAPRRFELPESAYLTTLRMMCDTGRLRLRRDPHDDHPPAVAWDDGPPWEFWLEVKPSPGGRYLVLEASLRRNTPPPLRTSPGCCPRRRAWMRRGKRTRSPRFRPRRLPQPRSTTVTAMVTPRPWLNLTKPRTFAGRRAHVDR